MTIIIRISRSAINQLNFMIDHGHSWQVVCTALAAQCTITVAIIYTCFLLSIHLTQASLNHLLHLLPCDPPLAGHINLPRCDVIQIVGKCSLYLIDITRSASDKMLWADAIIGSADCANKQSSRAHGIIVKLILTTYN